MPPPPEVVIVTGSSGRIGAAACRRLRDEGYAVAALDRPGPPHPPEGFEPIDLDLADGASVAGAAAEVRRRHGDRVASVLHLAAFYDFSGRPSPKYDAINVQGTARLLEALRPLRVEQFVLVSTMIVHAPCRPGERIDEGSPLGPRWPYPASKVEAEALARARRGDVPVVLLRPASVYDEMGRHPLLAQQVRRVFERRLTARVYPGDPERGQAFVHRDDLLDAILLLIRARGRLPAELPLLIGEPETPGYGRLQAELARLLHGEPWRTRRVPRLLAKAGAYAMSALPGLADPFLRPWMIDLADDHFALDVSRARELLGWTPRRSILATLPAIAGALKADPAGWYRANDLGEAGPS